MKRLLTVALLVLIAGYNAFSDPPTFQYGFGGGVNFSNIQVINSYPLYEDMSGTTYESSYSGLFRNLGSQYFFHGEFTFSSFYLSFKPGVYTYNFTKTDQILFNSETLEPSSTHLLRYLQMPVEAKWVVGSGTLKPFIGGEVSPAWLLRQGGSGNHSFIRPRFSLGPVGGFYYSLASFDIVLTAGYDYALHVTTSKSDRYNVTTGTSYSQSDIRQHNLNISLSILFSLEKGKSIKELECTYPNKRAPKKYKK